MNYTSGEVNRGTRHVSGSCHQRLHGSDIRWTLRRQSWRRTSDSCRERSTNWIALPPRPTSSSMSTVRATGCRGQLSIGLSLYLFVFVTVGQLSIGLSLYLFVFVTVGQLSIGLSLYLFVFVTVGQLSIGLSLYLFVFVTVGQLSIGLSLYLFVFVTV